MKQEEIPTKTRLLTVKQFAALHGWPVGGLRHLIFYKPDGFESVIKRVGRKVLLCERSFFEWVNHINCDKTRQK